MALQAAGEGFPAAGRGAGPAAAADPGAAALPAAIWGRRRQGWRGWGSGVEEEQLTVALTPIPPFVFAKLP